MNHDPPVEAILVIYLQIPSRSSRLKSSSTVNFPPLAGNSFPATPRSPAGPDRYASQIADTGSNISEPNRKENPELDRAQSSLLPPLRVIRIHSARQRQRHPRRQRRLYWIGRQSPHPRFRRRRRPSNIHCHNPRNGARLSTANRPKLQPIRPRRQHAQFLQSHHRQACLEPTLAPIRRHRPRHNMHQNLVRRMTPPNLDSVRFGENSHSIASQDRERRRHHRRHDDHSKFAFIGVHSRLLSFSPFSPGQNPGP